jgi:hypothetical protein
VPTTTLETVPPSEAVLLSLGGARRLYHLLNHASGWLITEPIAADLDRYAGGLGELIAVIARERQAIVPVPRTAAAETAALCHLAAALARPTASKLAGALLAVGDTLAHRAEVA